MRKALIFGKEEKTIISASDVLDNYELYKNYEFIDPEYNFRVKFVKDCKGHKGPYFRIYMSREDYKKLTPERKTKYEILSKQRHYKESPWHREWENNVSEFCEIEKYIKDEKTQSYKRADAYCKKVNTVFEFQHSYIENDFEKRNVFYSKLGINIVWLYDLTMMNVNKVDDYEFEILENNAKGFFKIAEKEENLKDIPVFIQCKNKLIYKVNKLERREIKGKLKSTIRFFRCNNIYTKEEFINGVLKEDEDFQTTITKNKKNSLYAIYELWKPEYSIIIVENTKNGKTIKITGKKDGTIFRDFNSGCINYGYVNMVTNDFYEEKNSKIYRLKKSLESSKIWKLIKVFYRKNNN